MNYCNIGKGGLGMCACAKIRVVRKPKEYDYVFTTQPNQNHIIKPMHMQMRQDVFKNVTNDAELNKLAWTTGGEHESKNVFQIGHKQQKGCLHMVEP